MALELYSANLMINIAEELKTIYNKILLLSYNMNE